jgi:hypothetical protein
LRQKLNWYWIYVLIVSQSFLVPLLLLNGCVNFRGIGEDLGEGVLGDLDKRIDSLSYRLGYNLMNGIADGIGKPRSQNRLQELLDSLIIRIGYTTNEQARKLRDSLLGDYTRRWIQDVRDDIIGDASRQSLGRLRDELLGDKTFRYIFNMRNEALGYNTRELTRGIISAMRDELLNDSTNKKSGRLRDELLGEKTNLAVRTIVDSAMISLVARYRSDLKPELESNLNFIQRNVTWILILIGIIVIVIVWFVWQQRQKYLRMSKMLTYQISEVKQPEVKESLKENISDNAKMIGIEDELRKLLEKQGILHES